MPMPSAFRFVREFLRSDPESVAREETTYRRAGETLPASLYRPARAVTEDALLPAWVALHGLTHRGRDHESLDTFARALAASHAVVLVPEIPEWRALRVSPAAATVTIDAAVASLGERSFIADHRIGVIGFSFGGTRALTASTDPALEGRLAAVVSWGGYASLRRALHYGFTGEHDLDGEDHYLDPDPYGRWVFAGNYLTDVPGHQDTGPVADALLWLGLEVGRRELLAWQPTTDPLKVEARERLAPEHRPLFDLLAPPTDAPVTGADRTRLARLAAGLAAAAAVRDPLLDPTERLTRVPVPVFLAHGRDDRLIPWTELPRLRRVLPDGRVRHSVITGLFSHSFGERWLPTPGTVVEAVRLFRAIRRMVRLI